MNTKSSLNDTIEKETTYIIAQLRIILNWIKLYNDGIDLIEQSSTPYKDWSRIRDFSQIETIANSFMMKVDSNESDLIVESPEKHQDLEETQDDVNFAMTDVVKYESVEFDKDFSPGRESSSDEVEEDPLSIAYNDEGNYDNKDLDYSCSSDNDDDEIADSDIIEGGDKQSRSSKKTVVGRKPASNIWSQFIVTRNPTKNNFIISNVCKRCGCHVSARVDRMSKHLQKCTNSDTTCITTTTAGSKVPNQQAPANTQKSSSSISHEEPKQTVVGRKLSSIWSHYIVLKSKPNINSKSTKFGQCKLCSKIIIGRNDRLMKHMATTHNNGDKNPTSQEIKNNMCSLLKLKYQIQRTKDSKALRKIGGGRKKLLPQVWSSFNTVRNETTRVIIRNNCKICNKHVTPRLDRLKKHLTICKGEDFEGDKSVRVQRERKSVGHQVNTQKTQLRDHILAYFEPCNKSEQVVEALVESNINPSTSAQSCCIRCGVSITARFNCLLNHLKVCQPEVAGQFERSSTKLGRKSIQCEEYGKILVGSQGQLAKHMLIHSDARPHPCETCGKTFRRKQELKMHILSVHKQIRIKRKRQGGMVE